MPVKERGCWLSRKEPVKESSERTQDFKKTRDRKLMFSFGGRELSIKNVEE